MLASNLCPGFLQRFFGKFFFGPLSIIMNQPTSNPHTNPMLETTANRLRADVEEICFPEGRVTGTAGHARAEEILCRRLAEIGCRPYRGNDFRLPYRHGNQDFVNLVGIIPGTGGSSLAPVLVGAHYDSVIPAPCADDNAAAVALALEAGRAAALAPLERDLVVAIFDAEEPPHFQGATMGSINFYEQQTDGRGFHAAVVMDLVGHDVPLSPDRIGAMPGVPSSTPGLPDLRDLLFVMGAESHPVLPTIIASTPDAEGIRVLPTLNEYVGDMSDHGIFRKNGVPYFFLSCGHWEHYHRTTDTPDRLNYKKMAAISDYLNRLLANLAATDLPRGLGMCDPLALEIERMQAILGPLLPSLLGRPGPLRTRGDIRDVVSKMRSTGL